MRGRWILASVGLAPAVAKPSRKVAACTRCRQSMKGHKKGQCKAAVPPPMQDADTDKIVAPEKSVLQVFCVRPHSSCSHFLTSPLAYHAGCSERIRKRPVCTIARLFSAPEHIALSLPVPTLESRVPLPAPAFTLGLPSRAEAVNGSEALQPSPVQVLPIAHGSAVESGPPVAAFCNLSPKIASSASPDVSLSYGKRSSGADSSSSVPGARVTFSLHSYFPASSTDARGFVAKAVPLASNLSSQPKTRKQNTKNSSGV